MGLAFKITALPAVCGTEVDGQEKVAAEPGLW